MTSNIEFLYVLSSLIELHILLEKKQESDFLAQFLHAKLDDQWEELSGAQREVLNTFSVSLGTLLSDG